MVKVPRHVRRWYRDYVGRDPNVEERRTITGASVSGWLNEILRKDDLRPDCEKLARAAQIVVNRHRNADLMRGGAELAKVKDVSPADESWGRYLDAQGHYRELQAPIFLMLAAVRNLKQISGDYCWTGKDGEPNLDLDEVERVLTTVSAAPPIIPTKSDQRLAPWHAVARQIACLIKIAMDEVGYLGNLRPPSEESVTAQLGTDIVNHVFALKNSDAAFVQVMKRQGPSDEDWEAARRIWDEVRPSKYPAQEL
jgi:hypothetical protein